jgi:Ras-related protein Rab-18
MASSPASSYDCSFKILLIGDSAVGKSSLLVSFVSASHIDDEIAPTIGAYGCLPPVLSGSR